MRGLWLIGLALLVSCGEISALPPCTGDSDCRDDQECLASACVERRGPSGPDAERGPDASGSGDATRPPEDATADASVEDAAVPDATLADRGVPDALADAGVVDAQVPDAADPDAAVPDAAVPDAAIPDAAVPDAAVPDAAIPDAAVVDAAVPDAAPDAALPCPLRPEVCNGLDDNCNGEADEGFDLQTDVNHCGRCNQACDAVAGVASTLCEAGQCFIGRCVDFQHDRDGDAATGCESPRVGGVLRVNRATGLEVANGADGSAERPFRFLRDAAIAADDNDIIDVAEGQYDEDVTLRSSYVTLRGQGAERTVINGSVRIFGQYARVADLTVVAAQRDVGITLDCPRGCAVVDTEVVQVGPATPNNEPRAGIRIRTGTSHVVHGNRIAQITGAAGPDGGPCIPGAGSAAVGVLLDAGATTSRVTANVIEDVVGGRGGTPANPPCLGSGGGGRGGNGYGVLLADSAGTHIVARNEIRRVRGGQGGAAQVNARPEDLADGHGGPGGLGAGVRLEGAGNRVLANRIEEVGGGPGGDAGGGRDLSLAGRAGSGFGFYFAPYVPVGALPPADLVEALDADQPALNNEVTSSNTVDREPVHYCHATPGWQLRNQTLTRSRNPTNLGKVVLVDCPGALVADNEIAGFDGGQPEQPTSGGLVSPGLDAAGIVVIASDGVDLVRNRISGLRGGEGGTGALDGPARGFFTTGGRGGAIAGLRLRDTNDARVQDNVVEGLTGGRGGQSGSAHGNAGPGGRASIVELRGRCAGNRLTGNVGTDLAGGEGGLAGRLSGALPPPAPGAGGVFGVYLEEPDALDNSLGFVEPGEAFNFVEGEAVWYVNRAAGVTLEPAPLQGPAQSTNLADFTLRASPGATVRGLSISGVQGEVGLPGPYASEGLAAPSVAAIRVIDSSDVRFEGGLVEQVRGGRGGRASVGTVGGTGGRAAGLWIERSPGSAVVGLTVRDILSGDGGAPFEAIRGVEETFGRPGRGGDAFGIIVSESDGTQVANVLVHHIVGHSGGVGLAFVGRVPMGGAGGLAYNVTVADFGHPSRFDPGIAPPDVYLDLGVGAYAGAAASLVNSIVAFGDGNGIGTGDDGAIIAGWSFIYGLGGASLGPGGFQTESVFTDFDPLFVDRAARDYSLAANSLCIDRGSPQGTCVDEPRPEGALECLTDLGHLGNTADAQFQ